MNNIFKFNIKNAHSLIPTISTSEQCDIETEIELFEIPKLDWVPPMQRRRLSKFMRMALYCAYQALPAPDQAIPTVFSSRHGDLHKTTRLLDAVAKDVDLSPTDFSMSVHNAASGLFSILTGSMEPANTIVSGNETFLMSLVDAYARLKSGIHKEVLVIHCDQVLPEPYDAFKDELQIDHAFAFVMSLTEGTPVTVSKQVSHAENVVLIPPSVTWVNWFLSKENEVTLETTASQWTFTKSEK